MIKITIYLTIEIILLFFYCLTRVCTKNIFLFQELNILPILLNTLYIFPKKIDERLKIAIILPFVADYIFLYTTNITLGISCFILIQISYHLYLQQNNNNTLYGIGILNIMLSLITNKLLIVEGIIYGFLSITNLFLVCKKSQADKRKNYLKYALLLLALCDTCIVIKYFLKNNQMKVLLDIIERIFYNISQLIFVFFAVKYTKRNDHFAKYRKKW